jgi:hypothetical protein
MRSRIPATAAADRTNSAKALEKGHENQLRRISHREFRSSLLTGITNVREYMSSVAGRTIVAN